MGRPSTGAYTTSECRKLDLRLMLKGGEIVKGKNITGTINWTDESSAGFESRYTEDEKYFRIYYTITKRNGEKFELDYKIQLVTVPSNLGKGEILFFICPESYKRARVLYMAYGNLKYTHRNWYYERYRLRLYYDVQQSSKRGYHNSRYFAYKKQVDTLEDELIFSKNRKSTYKGKVTKPFQKLYHLKNKMDYHDTKRCEILSKMLGFKFEGL